MNQFENFRKLSEKLSDNMTSIESHIKCITNMMEEETVSITDVSGSSENISEKMQKASLNGKVNEEIASTW